MILDLSYIHEKTLEEREEAIKRAVEVECMRAIVTYLNEVADTMETNGIETLSAPTLRAMAEQFNQRLAPNDDTIA